MAGRNNWTREQTMMAFALYRILPSGKWDKRNPTVQRLADHIPPLAFGGGAQTWQPGLPRREQDDQGTDQLQQAGQGNMGGVRGTRRRLVFESATAGIGVNGPDNRPAANAIPSWSRSSHRRSDTTVRPWSRNASTSSISATRSSITTMTTVASRESRSIRYWQPVISNHGRIRRRRRKWPPRTACC